MKTLGWAQRHPGITTKPIGQQFEEWASFTSIKRRDTIEVYPAIGLRWPAVEEFKSELEGQMLTHAMPLYVRRINEVDESLPESFDFYANESPVRTSNEVAATTDRISAEWHSGRATVEAAIESTLKYGHWESVSESLMAIYYLDNRIEELEKWISERRADAARLRINSLRFEEFAKSILDRTNR